MKPRHFGLLSPNVKLNLLAVFFIVSSLLISPLYAQQIETKTIKAEPIIKKINRTGKLAFKRTLNLSFKSSGYLKELNVDEGDSFTKGQLLAQLDTAELTAEKNASYARLYQAKREVKRTNTLLNKKLSSQQALDDAKTLVETTRASYKVAQYNLAKSKLFAPFNGVVLARFTELGELQSPSQKTLQLAALNNNLVVRVALTAAELNLISLQQELDINLTQLGVVTGVVSKVPAVADQQSHLFTIEVLLRNLTANQVVVGQLARVTTSIPTKELAYRVPIEALNSVDNQGRALIMLQYANSDPISYSQQPFEIKSLSNEYIYLSAQQGSLPFTVITQGWQHLALEKVDQLNEDK